jgi:ribosome assembly protein 4
MATVVPPPSKRRKREDAEKARLQQDPEPIPNTSVRIRFHDPATNEPIGPAVTVPLPQATASNLNILVNSLNGVEEFGKRIPYSFSLKKRSLEDTNETQRFILPSNGDIYTSFLKPGLMNTEEELYISVSPQAVFRVNPVSRCSSSISGHSEMILTAQFSPASGSRFATGSADFNARIWDCDTGTPMHTLKGHTDLVLCLAYSPDNSMIATGSKDNSIRIWEGVTGNPLGASFKGHTKFVRSLAWEPFHLEQRGRPRVASASKDGTVRVWDVVGRKTDFSLTSHKASVSCVRWGGTGLLYTASQDRTIKIWESKEGRLLHTLQGHAHWVNKLALSTDFVLRTAFYDHTGKTPATIEEKVAKAEERYKNASTINKRTVERLVSASDDHVLILWDPFSSNPTKPIAKMTGHQNTVNHVAFSPDGQYIASASFDNSVKLWSSLNGKFLHTLRGHVADVYQVVFSPDSRLLVSCSKDTTLKVWDVSNGKMMKDLPGHQDAVFAVDWSPDGQMVGSGGRDKAVRLWRN